MSIVPLVQIANMSTSSNSYASLTKDLAELYTDDLLPPIFLEHEVHLWHTKWNNCSDKIPAMSSEALLHVLYYLSVTRTCAQQVLHHRVY